MSSLNLDDTIAAIATPLGEGGISIIRMSGPEALNIARRIFKATKDIEFQSHHVYFGKIKKEDELIDQALLTFFKSPASYTGENTIEINCHGGLAISKKILDTCIQKGARLAEPGEFTKRAFLNGKIDLLQAEAVIDLIKARSDASVKVAVQQLEGGVSKALKDLKAHLMITYAHMEAFIDFPEEDIEVYEDQTIKQRFDEAIDKVKTLLCGFQRGSLMREGVSCAIVGKPNVGKSSLFNALLDRDRALVSSLEGTTRDMLEEAIQISGLYIRLIDTAGLGLESNNPLDQIGMDRTREILGRVSIILYAVDGSVPLDHKDEEAWKLIKNHSDVICLVNKKDQPRILNEDLLKKWIGKTKLVHLSAYSREGLTDLEKAMEQMVSEKMGTEESQQITRLRHKKALEKALEFLDCSKNAFLNKESLDLVTLDFKSALAAMSELLGETYSEDLLDVIFSEFCIGK